MGLALPIFLSFKLLL